MKSYENINLTGHPAPLRARDLFPNLDSVLAAGIEGLTADEARLVAAVVSLFIGKGRSKNRAKVGIMIGLLVPACRVEVVRDGQARAAALPDLPAGPWPSGNTPFNRLGIDHKLLESYWLTSKNRADDACLPLEWLLAFVPAPLWRAVSTLIKWGPYEAGVRAEEAATVLARTPIRRGTRRRADGSLIAAGTLENRADNLWALMNSIVELRAKVSSSANRSLPLSMLEAWTVRPVRVDVKACGAKEAYLDTAGPPIEDCSENLQRLFRDWEGASSKRRYRKLRRLLLQALLALVGPREDALRMLDVDDYLPDHLGSDGIRSPILRLYPGKTRDHDEAYLLPLPDELVDWIEAWIDLTGRTVGQAGSPMWPSRMPKSGSPIKRISEGGIYCAIAGREGINGRGGSIALIPRGANPYLGYNPHAFRHTAYQAAKRAGVKAKQTNPVEFGHIDQEDFARAVCGHSLEQSLKDAYLDLHQLRLARAAILYAWEDLWRGGKRHGLDPEAIIQHKNESAILAAAAHELEQTLVSLHQQQETLARKTATLGGDALPAALIESNRIAAETQLVLLDLNRTVERREAAARRLQQALVTEVPLRDELSAEEHARLLAAALDASAEEELGDDDLADELTVGDLAELYETTNQTINGWVRNGFPHGRPASWNPMAWIVESPRSKRLPVAAIDQTLLTAAQNERLTLIRRRRAVQLAGKADAA